MRKYTNISDRSLPFRALPARIVDGVATKPIPGFMLAPGESICECNNRSPHREALAVYVRGGLVREENVEHE